MTQDSPLILRLAALQFNSIEKLEILLASDFIQFLEPRMWPCDGGQHAFCLTHGTVPLSEWQRQLPWLAEHASLVKVLWFPPLKLRAFVYKDL